MVKEIRQELIEKRVTECLQELELEDHKGEVMELVDTALNMGYFSSITADSIAATSVYSYGKLENLDVTQRDAAYHCNTNRRQVGEHYPSLLHEYNQQNKREV